MSIPIKYLSYSVIPSLLLSQLVLSQLVLSPQAFAAGITGEVEEVIITADQGSELVVANTEAASVGTVLQDQLEHRPLLRPAEVLETIPGMVITQHSGGGKANQYFLRGFNLDHSTDFANHFEGAPVNMVTHGHGQGYSDFNFLIPELIGRMVYKKGPYYASEGDFSTAGSAHVYYANQLDYNEVKLTAGEDGYGRALFHGGTTLNNGDAHIVYALAKTEDDGPWTRPEELERDNAFLKYSQAFGNQEISISGLYFDSSWYGTDQIPRRLVESGELDRYDTLDETTGGETHRYQLSLMHDIQFSESSKLSSNLYWVDYELSLTGNFTYYSNDIPTTSPVPGVAPRDINDQVTQFDERDIYGGQTQWQFQANNDHQLNLGVQFRYDDISNVGVGSSYERDIYQLSSQAVIDELSLAGFASLHSDWTPWLATIVGVRYDHFTVDGDVQIDTDDDGIVDSTESGKENDDLVTAKFSMRLSPSEATDIFFNYGQGFHSNDARGVITDDVPLLAETEGFEVGITNNSLDALQLSFVLFQIDLDSELIFVGDDGTTEPKDSTRRQGFELSTYYQPVEWFILDADYTWAKARFREDQYDNGVLLGDYVPDSIEDVFSLGVSVDWQSVFGGIRLRYFGPRSLTEDGSIESDSSSMVNANIGYAFNSGFASGLSLSLEVLNLFDTEDDDITYWYASRTQDERDQNIQPQDDYHFHPMIPRTMRVTAAYRF